jgi:hypothetical protein
MDKEMVQMRIAEEAMLRGLEIRYTQSTNDRVIADGDGFHVHATLNEKYGWVIKAANMEDFDDVVDDVYEDDDDESGDDNEEEKKKEKLKPLRTPLFSDWIVPLIKEVIAVKPNFCLHHKQLHDTQSRICRISIKLMPHIFNLESIPSTQHMAPQLMQTHRPSHLEYFLGMKTKRTGSSFGNLRRCCIHTWTARRSLS